MNDQTLPKRADLPVAMTWNLESVYKTNNDWEADFSKVTKMLPKLAAFKGKLTKTGKNLLDALKLRDEIGSLVGKLYCYANMRFHQDTTDAIYQALADRADKLSTDVSAASSFITPELLATPSKRLTGLLARSKELRVYEHEFDELDRQRPHVRSAEIEAILAQAAELASGPDKVFQMINDADLKLPKIKDTATGKEIQLTHGNYASFFLEHSDREMRRAGFEGLHRTFSEMRNTMAANYAAQVKTNVFFAKQRNYGSAREAALGPVNIPTSVYDNLLATVDKNLPKLHRYLELRKKLLGLADLKPYDLYVPMVEGVDYKVSYEDAVDKCLESLAPLGDKYVAALRKGFADRWADVMENEGKHSGAYSWGSYNTHPFMLLNWQPTMDSMFTLIHESGHSMHSYLTRKSQPYCYGSYTLFVAEVASICNEMLLAHYLLKTTQDRSLRMYIINHVLETFRTTLFRQCLFAAFEKEAHEKAEAGEALTPDLLCQIYRDLNQKYYGAVVDVDGLLEVEWSRIPHFYNSFYVYQYATGMSAAVALSSQILTEGAPAVKRYLDFLSSGSSKYSLDLLQGAGVDMSSPEPVQKALDVFEQYIGEFEKLSAAAPVSAG